MAQQLYRLRDVLSVTGWSKSTLYEKIREKKFPGPIKPDPDGRAVAWLSSEVDAHQQSRIAARDNAAKAA
jgi:prophage regulatory protein